MGTGVATCVLKDTTKDAIFKVRVVAEKQLRETYGDVEVYQMLVDFADNVLLLKYRGENVCDGENESLQRFLED